MSIIRDLSHLEAEIDKRSRFEYFRLIGAKWVNVDPMDWPLHHVIKKIKVGRLRVADESENTLSEYLGIKQVTKQD